MVRRRGFLAAAGRAALAAPLLMSGGCFTRHAVTRTASPGWNARISDLEGRIPRLMEENALPGLSIAIIRDAAIAWHRGFGTRDIESNEPVDARTIFNVGSMSKPVFAYLVLKLHERRLLDLDTPLTRYTPERYVADDPRLDLITARHVLSHTSGFQNWRSADAPLKIHFNPGERYMYSGEGYSYLQSVVTRLAGRVDPTDCAPYETGERVCATDIDQYLTKNLLAPLGMTSSGYVWSEKLERHGARPHDAKGRRLEWRKPAATDAARYAAAGLLHTTASDFAKFMIAILRPGAGDAYRLRRATVAEMLRPAVTLPDDPFRSSWALGWQVQQTGVINHGGDNAGYHAQAAASPQNRTGFVIMTNGDGGTEVLRSLLLDGPMDQFL